MYVDYKLIHVLINIINETIPSHDLWALSGQQVPCFMLGPTKQRLCSNSKNDPKA